MKITFLGVGSAFAKHNSKSNILIECGHVRLLVDCGSSAPQSLRDSGYTLRDMTHIFITHLHYDHVGGLEEFAWSVRFRDQYRPVIFSTDSLLRQLWLGSLRGGLEYVEAFPGEDTPQTLNDFFKPMGVDPNQWLSLQENEPLQVMLYPSDHIKHMESYALFVRDAETGKQFLFSGDTRLDLQLIQQGAESCDLMFHDCQLFDTGENNQLGVHTSYNQLKTIPRSLREKMWLYHYGDTPLPDAESEGFLGFVKHHQQFIL